MVSLRHAAAVALALVPLAGTGAASAKDLPPPPARAGLTVRAGRMTLVQGERVRVLTRASARTDVVGSAYAEVGVRAEIELSWPGSASLRVSGPAAFEWSPTGEVRVLRADRIEFEVRRGRRSVSLPGGWTLPVGRAALSLAETSVGDWNVEHRGGDAVTVENDGDAEAVLHGGARVVLKTVR